MWHSVGTSKNIIKTMEENKKSYFGEIGAAVKTLAVGMKTTWREYFTPKSTEQYPENRKTTLHIAARHRGRLDRKSVV